MAVHLIPLSKIFPREEMMKLSAPEQERNLAAAVMADGRNFKAANLPSSAFTVPR
jgi:hypothetical protein